MEEGLPSVYDPTDDFNVDQPNEERPHIVAPDQSLWFHGRLSREDAQLALAPHKPGAFLVRASVRHNGDYSLSVRTATTVQHFQIITDDFGGFFIADNEFPTLGALVEHYYNELIWDNMPLLYHVPPKKQVAPDQQKVRKVGVAVADYIALAAEELSLLKGDRVFILNADDEHWIFASLGDGSASGFIPRSAVSVTDEVASMDTKLPEAFARNLWLHSSRTTRQLAEEILGSAPVAGSFLVRASTNGEYSLSFRTSDKVQHFKIRCEGGKFECGSRKFDTIDDIVARYISEPLLDNLTLVQPIKESSSSYDVDRDVYSDPQSSARKPPSSPIPAASATPASSAASTTAAVASLSVSAAPSSPAPSPSSALKPAQTAAPPKPTRQASTRSMRVDKSGVLVKRQRNSKRWKAYTVSLWCDKRRLFYFESPTAMKPKGIIDLGGCSMFSLDDSLYGRPNCFQLIVCGSDVVFCADTEQEKSEWMAALQPLVGFTNTTAAVVNPMASAVVRSLSVCVVEAKDFASKVPAAFCTISISDVKVARTPTLAVKSNSAFWNEEFAFNNLADGLESISVELFQRGKLNDQEVASGEVPLTTLQPGATSDRWLVLRTRDGHDYCSVRLKLVYEQETLLPLTEYAPLQRLLLAEDLASPLLLADICHTHLNDVARNLLLIWRRVHHEVEMLDALNRRVIEAETDPATLFRGNTLASKALDHYMKMVAMPYLHSTLAKPVKDLFEERRSCELDPSRGGKPENAKVLLAHVTSIANSVFESVDRCPSTLRTVFARLREAAIKKFPASISVKYTAVSGFVFLRLFCPAIINPKLFNMLTENATDTTARSLMLAAKVLQNLANMSEFGQKEEYMQPCNDLLAALRPRMQVYLDTLASPTRNDGVDTVFVTHPSRPLASLMRLCLNKQQEFASSSVPVAKPLLETVAALQAKAASK